MGWLQNLFNRIMKKRLPESRVESYEEVPNNIDKYTVNVSNMGTKSRKEIELEEAVKSARMGNNLYELPNNYTELNLTDLYACSSIGAQLAGGFISDKDISTIGGMEKFEARLVQEAEKLAKQYTSIEIHKFIGNPSDLARTMKEEIEEKQYRESFSLSDTTQRRSTLNQLYNSAFELISSGNNIDENILLNYANQRGGAPIQVGGENPYVENVDIKAAINLARNVAYGYTDKSNIEAASIIKEMSINAKLKAKEFGYTQDQAGEFIEDNPNGIIKKISKENTYEQTL